ncbi:MULTISPECIES: ParB/RepB/Spo0J family partition protein [Pelosinus]|jgi:ParB family chromosome partitioning protein|uniref:ParB-like partition protein n=1 Tax=Pelosinus fermentans B4 TaxID=1149862 RepID=I8RHX3_9FIRM|nr:MULTISPECIES: ParB/RepB/Spo0J family partition protein [Pelosinus]EIW17575.1 parB-like partition protein [Pelosinus fermentans B4]EIW23312.1 parB-like partition protein [Pelosinus fermentans A11]
MMNNNSQRGLGRGLDALFSSSKGVDAESLIKNVSISEIIPNKFQPRRVFDETALLELVSSISQYGVLQPLVVRKSNNIYELVAGERRLRASQQAGLKEIPVIIKDYTDREMTEISLIENIQREDLNAIEEALAYRRLMDEFRLTQEEVAKKIGRSRSVIANMVRLLNLHPKVQDYVSRGTLSMGQSRPLLALETLELQLEAAEIIIENDLSARDAEELVKRIADKKKPAKQQPKNVEEKNFFVTEAEDRLKMILGTQVKIKEGKFKSKIEIEFSSSEDLERILEVLSGDESPAPSKSRGTFAV